MDSSFDHFDDFNGFGRKNYVKMKLLSIIFLTLYIFFLLGTFYTFLVRSNFFLRKYYLFGLYNMKVFLKILNYIIRNMFIYKQQSKSLSFQQY